MKSIFSCLLAMSLSINAMGMDGARNSFNSTSNEACIAYDNLSTQAKNHSNRELITVLSMAFITGGLGGAILTKDIMTKKLPKSNKPDQKLIDDLIKDLKTINMGKKEVIEELNKIFQKDIKSSISHSYDDILQEINNGASSIEEALHKLFDPTNSFKIKDGIPLSSDQVNMLVTQHALKAQDNFKKTIDKTILPKIYKNLKISNQASSNLKKVIDSKFSSTLSIFFKEIKFTSNDKIEINNFLKPKPDSSVKQALKELTDSVADDVIADLNKKLYESSTLSKHVAKNISPNIDDMTIGLADSLTQSGLNITKGSFDDVFNHITTFLKNSGKSMTIGALIIGAFAAYEMYKSEADGNIILANGINLKDYPFGSRKLSLDLPSRVACQILKEDKELSTLIVAINESMPPIEKNELNESTNPATTHKNVIDDGGSNSENSDNYNI